MITFKKPFKDKIRENKEDINLIYLLFYLHVILQLDLKISLTQDTL